MSQNIKNIIIFTVVAIALVLIYIFFIKKAPDQGNLVSSSTTTLPSDANVNISNQNSLITKDLLSVLLSVKSIKLDDSIFSDKAFVNLHDSSIVLPPLTNGQEGRSNPFAPIGYDILTPAPTLDNSISPTNIPMTSLQTISPATPTLVPTPTPAKTLPVAPIVPTKTPAKGAKTP